MIGLGLGLGIGLTRSQGVAGFKNRVFVTGRGQVLGQKASAPAGLSASTIIRSESRIRFAMGYQPATDLKLVYPSYYINPVYTLAPNPYTLTAAIEQGGVNKPAAFAAASSRIVNPADLLVSSDVVTSSAAASEQLYVRSGAEITIGQQIPIGYLRYTGMNEQVPITDSGASQVPGVGNMLITTPYSHGGSGFGVSGITGLVTSYMASVVIFGDSLAAGTTDTIGENGILGMYARGIAATGIPVVNASRGSNRSEFSTPSVAPGQFLLLDWSTWMLDELGTNDFFISVGTRPLETIKSEKLAIWATAKAKGNRVAVALVLNRVQPGGDYTSEVSGAQTPEPRFVAGGDVDLYNQWVLDRLADGTIHKVFDLRPYWNSEITPGYIKANMTLDGVHPANSTVVATLATQVAAVSEPMKNAP